MPETGFAIAGRPIGAGHPVYIVAELSANHHQDLDTARKLVDAAAAAGADAVKLQTYTPDTITLDLHTELFRIREGTVWAGRTLYELYSEAQTPWSWHAELASRANALGIHCFSTPFDPTAVAFLETLEFPAYKVASFELVDIPLLTTIARTGKPMIVSTGMATLDEITEAVNAVRAAGTGPLALLRTSSAYPAPSDELDLRTIPFLSRTFGVVAGLSDHTLGTAAAAAAVALGAHIIEKHLTLTRATPGPDSAFSLEPAEFKAMVDVVRAAREAPDAESRAQFGPTPRERPSLQFRRSLFAVRDIGEGDRLTPENVRSIRPAAGLHPRHLMDVVGRRAARDIALGTPLTWDLLA